MSELDYEQYHQKGGTYVIPVEVFDELLEENQELNKQLEEYKKWYQDALEENSKLSELWCDSRTKIKELKNQQKEFVEYVNKTIEELECGDVDDEEMKGYLIQRIDTFKEILSKYKSILGEHNG